jgi:hypothetical protein
MKIPLQLLQRFLVINLVIISCTHSKSPNTGPSTVNKDTTEGQLQTFDLKRLPNISTIKLSEIGAIDIEYLPLNTTPQNVIQNIHNIIFGENYFLIRENSSIKSPSMYRYDGSFVTKIGTEGRGPNEFSYVNDIDINPQNESIYIANSRQSKFLVYNKNGSFIRTFRSPLTGEMKFKFTTDGILCYYNNSQGNIENSFILIDTTGKIIKTFPNKYLWKRIFPGVGYEGENLYYTFNSQLFKKEIYCDTIFAYNNKAFEPYMIIDEGNQRITPDIRTNIRTMAEASDVLHNYIDPWNLFEFGDFLYYELGITINGVHDLFSFIGSKKNNFKTMVVPYEGLINDIDGGPSIWPRTVRDGNTIVSWIEALKFKEYIASDAFKNSTPEYPDKKKELEKLAKNINESDNPILILIKIK